MTQSLNTLSRPIETAPSAARIQLGERPQTVDIHVQRRQNLSRSIIRRWWYYGFVTLLAAAGAYYVGKQYGSAQFEAVTQIRACEIPLPPGPSRIDQPEITEFWKHLKHPDVLGEVIGPEFRVQTFDSPPVFEQELNYETKVLTLKLARETPLKAAETLNALVDGALEQSTTERNKSLDASLEYLGGIIVDAQHELASVRAKKTALLDELRARHVSDASGQARFDELSQIMQLRQSELLSQQSQLADSQRLLAILRQDERRRVQTIASEVTEDLLATLNEEAARFSEGSPQAKEIGEKAAQIAKIADRDIADREELLESLHDLRQFAGTEIIIPPEHDAALERIADGRYEHQNQLDILPEKIARTEQLLAAVQRQRAEVEVAGAVDLEEFPEVQDLNREIERAEFNVNQIASDMQWTQSMQKQDAPYFEQLVVASPESCQPDSDFKKLFVLTFGCIGLVLGGPMLALDIFKPPLTPLERTAEEHGLPIVSTYASTPPRQTSALPSPGDPELRLLALQLQKMAEVRPGLTVLFSSLTERKSSAPLLSALADCLAARGSNVMILDLESFGQPPRKERWSLFRSKRNRPTDAAESAESVSLTTALAEGSHSPEDVLVQRGTDGIDRVALGDGNLPREAFSQPLMKELLAGYRGYYTTVLIAGPNARHLADVQTLATMCDGTLFVSADNERTDPQARRTLTSLSGSSTNVFGIAKV